MTDRKVHPKDSGKKSHARMGRQAAVYGGEASICTNSKCVMRKNAKCSGYEGCPGFRGK